MTARPKPKPKPIPTTKLGLGGVSAIARHVSKLREFRGSFGYHIYHTIHLI